MKKILTLYEEGGKYLFVVKEKVIRVCHEELIECFMQALKDIYIAETISDLEGEKD